MDNNTMIVVVVAVVLVAVSAWLAQWLWLGGPLVPSW